VASLLVSHPNLIVASALPLYTLERSIESASEFSQYCLVFFACLAHCAGMQE